MVRNGQSPFSIVRLEGVSKWYNGEAALSSLSLEIKEGERVAVLGPSGSGKTTMLHLIAGMEQPNDGRVLLAGQPLSTMNAGPKLAELVGMMHQQLDLVPHLSVEHNVQAGRLGRWSLWKSLVSLVSLREREMVLKALERVGIPEKLHERTSHLSGGEQQRVAMARLLAQQSRVVLADEPVASLDPARAEDLMHLLVSIVTETNKTLIASVHSTHLTRKYFSRAVGLRKGTLEFDLPVEHLTDAALNRLYNLAPIRP